MAGGTLKGTSKQYGLPLMTFKRLVRRQKENKEELQYETNYKKSQMFTETDLVQYLATASKL